MTPVSEMGWQDMTTELTAHAGKLRLADRNFVAEIAKRGCPNRGEPDRLRALVQWVRGEVNAPPGLIGQNDGLSAWGMQPAGIAGATRGFIGT